MAINNKHLAVTVLIVADDGLAEAISDIEAEPCQTFELEFHVNGIVRRVVLGSRSERMSSLK